MITRLLDLVFSSLAIICLSPLLILIVLVLRFSGEREVFYVQQRIGRNGKSFGLYKFATMLKNSPKIGSGTITLQNDPRVLPVGRLLRSSKINELPQLLNVLIGDMSLIGPRPLTKEGYMSYSDSGRIKIYSNRPGLSGVGSIIFRNEEKLLSEGQNALEVYKEVIAPYKEAAESWYTDHASLTTYLGLIVLTVFVVFSRNSDLIWRYFPDLPKPGKELSMLFESSSVK